MKNMLRLCYAFKNQNQMIKCKYLDPMFITSTLKTNTMKKMRLRSKDYSLLCHYISNKSNNNNIGFFFIILNIYISCTNEKLKKTEKK